MRHSLSEPLPLRRSRVDTQTPSCPTSEDPAPRTHKNPHCETPLRGQQALTLGHLPPAPVPAHGIPRVDPLGLSGLRSQLGFPPGDNQPHKNAFMQPLESRLQNILKTKSVLYL